MNAKIPNNKYAIYDQCNINRICNLITCLLFIAINEGPCSKRW